MWFWGRMHKYRWIHHARNEAVLRRVKKEMNILQTVKKEDKWMGTSCLLKRVIE